MFTKLLEINIVAKRLLGLSSRKLIFILAFSFDDFKSLACFGVMEKNAISAPEISAEKTNNIKIVKSPIIILIEKPFITVAIAARQAE